MNHKTIYLVLSIFLLVTCLPAWSSQTRFHDFGSSDDADEKAELHLWPRHMLRIGRDLSDFIHYETPDQLWWCTTPKKKTGNMITARVVQAGAAVEIRAKEFLRPPQAVYLLVRYKDNLKTAIPVYVFTADGWQNIGQLAGEFDHKWKNALVVFSGGAAPLADGGMRFRIGSRDGADVCGEIPIDYIRITDTPPPTEPVTPGFYPETVASRFPNLGQSRKFKAGKAAEIPLGLILTGARTDTWKRTKDMGYSHASFIGWEITWRSHWRVYTDNRYVDRVDAGLPEWLQQAKENGLWHMPAFHTDGFSWYIRTEFGSEKDAVKAIGQYIHANRKADALLAWIMKTRVDVEAIGQACPLEYAVELASLSRKKDPAHPVAMVFEGTKPEVYNTYREAFDICMFDYGAVQGLQPLGSLGSRIDEARRQVGSSKAIWVILDATPSPSTSALEKTMEERKVMAQGYLALIHGADGIWFSTSRGPEYRDLSDQKESTDQLIRFSREMNDGKDAVLPYFLPPYKTIDRNGSGKVLKASDPAIHYSLQKGPDQTWRLVAVNTSTDRKVNVSFKGYRLRNGSAVVVEQEDRLLAVTFNAIKDTFEPRQRHVYRIIPVK